MISESDDILLQLSGGKNCHLLQQHTCCSKHFLSIPRHFDRDLFDIKRLASTTLARFHYKSCLPCSVTGCQNASRTNYPFKQARVSATPQQLSILSQAAFPLMVLLFRWSEPKSMVLTTLFCSWEFKIFVSRTSYSFFKPVSVHQDSRNWQLPFEWKQFFAFNFAIKHWWYGCGV